MPDKRPPTQQPATIQTDMGDVSLQEYCLGLAGRSWSILHTHAMLTYDDELHFFRELRERLPYGVALWPASIALAHDIAERSAEFSGRRVLELGAGTGLPGIVAASFGALVTQTDRHELALAVSKRNAERNQVPNLEQRLADWNEWTDPRQYDWIIGSDILYSEALHAPLRHIFEHNLAPGGRVLLADPFRAISFRLLEALEAGGWQIAVSTWSIGEEATPRPIGIFELTPS